MRRGADLFGLDTTAQADLVRRREMSALELVDAAIANIERLDPHLNAVVHRRFERASGRGGISRMSEERAWYDSCWTRARRSRASLGISTSWGPAGSAMRVRPDGAETRATWEIWRRKISRLTSPARMIAKSDVSPRARALLLFSTRRWAGSD